MAEAGGMKGESDSVAWLENIYCTFTFYLPYYFIPHIPDV